MPIFKLSATETVHSVEWSHFAQKCIKFHPHPSRFQKNFPVRNPGSLLIGQGREGMGRAKVFVPLKEVQRERTGGREGWEWKGREGASGRENLAPRS